MCIINNIALAISVHCLENDDRNDASVCSVQIQFFKHIQIKSTSTYQRMYSVIAVILSIAIVM